MLKQKIFFSRSLALRWALATIGCVCLLVADAQVRRPGATRPRTLEGAQRPNASGQTQARDTIGFEHRDDLADSITISYRYLDSLRSNPIDSSLDDYGKIFSVPTGYLTLGNNGSAAFPVLYEPYAKPGWDAGFHAFDVYRYNIENTRFYKTTRPFTELSYFLATGKEQVVKVLHTQNIRPNWNAGIQYRLISSPGLYQSQNVNHNNYRFFSNYQGKRKRYAAYLVLQGNKLVSSENGGIADTSNLSDPTYEKRFTVPVKLGIDASGGYNLFSTKMNLGNTYSDFNAFFRQSYDLGKKDSIIINDSTTEYLFYPKLRFQHTISYNSYSYQYMDRVDDPATAKKDSGYYNRHYDITLHRTYAGLDFWLMDEWQFVSNDFVIRQFPQTKNLGQFIEAGLRLENFSGRFSSSPNPQYIIQVNPGIPDSRTRSFYNVVLHGEYRNKTRNKKWDAQLNGEFYAAGDNAADFSVKALLNRFLNSKFGDVQISFQNVNRSPAFIYRTGSAFNPDSTSLTKKENITIIAFEANNPRFSLKARNISIANYAYFSDFYKREQYNGLINITQLAASTKNKIVGHLNLYSDFVVQQTAGQNPIRVPLFYTRQRLAFEGNFFKNLNLSIGVDVRYHTPYKANDYSPVVGHFIPQDSVTISNLPQVNGFINFRIKSFSAFITGENVNTVSFANGFAFTNNNFTAPNYPDPGFLLRFGLQWRFVN